MEWWILLIIVFSALMLLLLLGVPITYSLGSLSVILGITLIGPKIFYLFGSLAYGKVNTFALVAVPLFIFMAELILVSGAANDAFDMFYKWLGALPGGLAIAAQFACALFASVCGASTATTAVVGGMAVPEMLKKGYEKRMATGSIAAGGALGVLIPPSLLFIIYGVIAEVSIGQLFIAGVIPGILMALERVGYFLVVCSVNPSLGPPAKFSWKDRFASTWKVLPLMLLAISMLVALYTGICTPTEIGGIGAFFSIIIALAYQRLNFEILRQALMRTTQTTCFIVFILVSASSLGNVLTYAQIPQQLVEWASSLEVSRYVILVYINFILILLGCIMDPGAIIMICVPMLAPMMESLGFDLIWFGVMFVINMELAEITPPLGLNLFVMKSVSPPEVSLNDIMIGSIPFMVLDVLTVVLVIIFPSIILWLPSQMM